MSETLSRFSTEGLPVMRRSNPCMRSWCAMYRAIACCAGASGQPSRRSAFPGTLPGISVDSVMFLSGSGTGARAPGGLLADMHSIRFFKGVMAVRAGEVTFRSLVRADRHREICKRVALTPDLKFLVPAKRCPLHFNGFCGKCVIKSR